MNKKIFPSIFFVLFLFLVLFPYKIIAASLKFDPGLAQIIKDQIISVGVIVDTQDTDVNAVGIYFSYPKEKLEVINVDFSGSPLSFFAENKAGNGEVRIAGGTPTPGFSGVKKVATIVFRVLDVDDIAQLTFSPDTAVVSDRGNKNVLYSKNSGIYFSEDFKNSLNERVISSKEAELLSQISKSRPAAGGAKPSPSLTAIPVEGTLVNFLGSDFDPLFVIILSIALILPLAAWVSLFGYSKFQKGRKIKRILAKAKIRKKSS